ncbi:MAG: sigma-70 family RNA polymerase sigma factor [Ignavibacteria bacterium]|nr:sigma-70 family RNA polymerase sigma factor [Ignavibacteria bacterium]
MAQITELNKIDYSVDINLLKNIADKDSHALSKFYDIHSKYLYNVIYYILKDEAEAEDTLQEVFMQVWDKADSYDADFGNPLAWIVRISRNKSIDKLRCKSFKNRSREIGIEKIFNLSDNYPAGNPERNSNLTMEQSEIYKSLSLLKENQRCLIEFAYFKGYSQTQLSEHFDIPLGTIKSRMRAGMMLLRNQLMHLIC